MNITGLGIDLEEIARFEPPLRRYGPRFLRHLCREEEITRLPETDLPVHCAILFACKEAVGKALGTGIGAQVTWKSIELLPAEAGAFKVHLHPPATKLTRSEKIYVRYSHHIDAHVLATAVIS